MTETPGHGPTLEEVIAGFLADLTQANRSAHTCRAYATDLKQFAGWHRAQRRVPIGRALQAITPATLRAYFATLVHLRPATRARKQAALASFLAWAYGQQMVESNPMGRVERVRHNPPAPRGVGRAQVEVILAVIPATQRRDRLLFRLPVDDAGHDGALRPSRSASGNCWCGAAPPALWPRARPTCHRLPACPEHGSPLLWVGPAAADEAPFHIYARIREVPRYAVSVTWGIAQDRTHRTIAERPLLPA